MSWRTKYKEIFAKVEDYCEKWILFLDTIAKDRRKKQEQKQMQIQKLIFCLIKILFKASWLSMWKNQLQLWKKSFNNANKWNLNVHNWFSGSTSPNSTKLLIPPLDITENTNICSSPSHFIWWGSFQRRGVDNSDSNSRRCSFKRSFLKVIGKIWTTHQTMRSSYYKGRIMCEVYGC